MAIDWASQPSPGEARSRRGADTRQRIIVAAAELFAERGVGAVSPQEILQAAGQRNSSAIQYHFGSHEGLVIAVLQPRPDIRGPIEEARTELLDQLLSGGAPLTLEGAVRAYAEPTTQVLRTPEGRAFIRVAAQIIRTLTLEHRIAPAMPSERRAIGTMTRVMPALPERIRAERLGVVTTLITELLGNRARELTHGLTPHLPEDAFTTEVVAMIVGLLRAPAALPGPAAAADPGPDPVSAST